MKSLSLSQPHAIIMIGIPGSGKSFFAEKFAETFHTPLVSTDRISQHAINSEHTQALGYLQLQELLKTKQSLVVDGLSDSRAERTTLVKGLKQFGYCPLFVWVQVDPELARTRYKKQNSATNSDFEDAVSSFDTPNEKEQALVVSGRHTYATQVRAVLKRLAAPRAAIRVRQTAPARATTNTRQNTK